MKDKLQYSVCIKTQELSHVYQARKNPELHTYYCKKTRYRGLFPCSSYKIKFQAYFLLTTKLKQRNFPMFRCYSRRFYFKGEICMQVTIGRTEILSVNRPKRDNFPYYIMLIKEFQHRYSKTNINNYLLYHLCLKQGKIPMFSFMSIYFRFFRSKFYEQGKIPLLKLCQKNAHILKPKQIFKSVSLIQ